MAEYIAQTNTAYDVVRLCGLLSQLGILDIRLENCYLKTVLPATVIFADNQGVIKLIKNLKYYCKTKHISIKYHKISELVKNRVVRFKWISTKQIVANNLTRSVKTVKFKVFITILGLVDL